ncbi:DNA recombination protein RmuC [Zhouia amylolytica]|uniref:DNA recombination protein RmuC n=1 Tax=Zhouia amylolytica TaxID=376730 RepID=A0A1I6QJD2_9FLAO|nr:DNA recombination protein RmuC [Zhouia amylolytica]MCQ0111240.1 DNA recombination protein RmuC [Zhouia amylolytica]SFS52475.1 DNA recombination protein RmuC [Zhouia amylolytica]
MSENLLLIIIALIFGAIGIFLGIYIQKLKSRSEESSALERENQLKNSVEELRSVIVSEKEAYKELQKERESIFIQLTKKEADFENLKQKNLEYKEEVEQLQEKFTKDFQILANKILEEKSEKFTLQNKENIKNILNPLQEKIQHFEKRVEDSNKESITRHSALQEQLKNLRELNQQITKEASNLTKALKGDTKMQGNWGELVLERVLEKSGLEKGSEYTVQNSFTTEEGKRVLPDVIINLPDNKKMIVDSKVSLIAYERFVNEEDELLKPGLLKEHVNSIKKHVDQLSAKNYHDLYKIESPDFVLLFIPMEPAFAIASQEEPQLYNTAFEKNIVIVTPSTLLATLRTIDSMWQNDKQHKNALDIAIQAGRLYDQFKNLLDDLEKVGKQLQTVQNTYSSSMTKLTGRGNLLTRIEKLKKLGAKASKQIDQKWLNRANHDDELID